MSALVGSIVSSGISALGGLLGKNKTGMNDAARMTRKKYKWIVDGAHKAGFNPLTALMAGGASVSGPATGPKLSSASFIGEALSRAADSWFNREQIARDEQLENLRVQTMQAELEILKNQGQMQVQRENFGFRPPVLSEPQGSVRVVGPALTNGAATQGVPSINDPVLVMRNDGLTAGNPDSPVEGEVDMWGWAREGTLGKNTSEVYNRNTAPWAQPTFWAKKFVYGSKLETAQRKQKQNWERIDRGVSSGSFGSNYPPFYRPKGGYYNFP